MHFADDTPLNPVNELLDGLSSAPFAVRLAFYVDLFDAMARGEIRGVDMRHPETIPLALQEGLIQTQAALLESMQHEYGGEGAVPVDEWPAAAREAWDKITALHAQLQQVADNR